MGVLWFRYVETNEEGRTAYFNVALSPEVMKNDPENESYLDIGTDRGVDDYFFGDEEIWPNGGYSGANGFQGWTLRKKLDKEVLKDTSLLDFERLTQTWRLRPWTRDDWTGSGWQPTFGAGTFTIKNGWAVPAYDAVWAYRDRALNEGHECYFEMYVGTPYVFASIKGEGGEDTSGKGSTLTIKKNQLKIIKEGDYSKPDGTSGHSDGVVLPETSKIVIEEGGVLSVEGNFLNNGTIENNGGTIIIKDGGCISPFGDTDEGTIKNVGGTIIVMPKGRLFCLVDDLKEVKATPPLSLYSSDSQSSGLINFGLTVISRALADKASKIENRNGGTLLVAHKRTDSSVLFHSAKVIGSGQNTGVKGISVVSSGDSNAGDYSIHGAIDSVKPTVVNEKKATFVYKTYSLHRYSKLVTDADGNRIFKDYYESELVRDYSEPQNGEGGFTIITPKY